MGCDIHCYIEYKRNDRDGWSDFGGRINPGRNYGLFGFMGGVRSHAPHIDPRGWPHDCANAAFQDNTNYVCETQKEATSHNDGERTYSVAHAEEYVAKGYCEWVERNGHKCWVTNFDHHTHSWLTADEFELAIAGYLKANGFQINTPRLPAPETVTQTGITSPESETKWALNSITEYWAILSALRCFEAQGHSARLVFWFYN